MFSLLSNRITDFLLKKQVISQEKKEVYEYGFEVFLLNVFDVLIIFILGIFVKRLLDTIAFLFVFGITRQYTGGYHAKTVLKCTTIYVLIYLSIMLVSSSNIVLSNGIAFQISMCLLYLIAVILYAPIQNDNKTISCDNAKKYKIISVILAVVMSAIAIGLYYILPFTAVTVTLTLFSVTILMFFSNNRK